MAPYAAGAVLATAAVVAVAGHGCSFDPRARPPTGSTSGQGAIVASAPDVDAGTPPSAAAAPPTAGIGASAGSEAPPSIAEPIAAGTTGSVPLQPDAAVVMPEPALDSGVDLDATTQPPADADADVPDAADAMEPPAVEPGSVFSPCSRSADCTAGLLCTASLPWAAPGAAGYCAAFCNTSDASIGGCEQPTSGSVRATCELTTRICQLGSCERLQCPTALRCAKTETPIGGGQFVSMFACAP
jgi:hypothetical protein